VSSVASGRIRALTPYQPGEQPREPDLIKLNTNENPYPPSPRVIQAIAEAAADGLNRYPSPMADGLRRAAAERYGVSQEQVLAGNGSDELLALCLRACVTEGGTVAYAIPTYSLYRTLSAIVGARVIELPAELKSVRGDLIAAQADVTFLCSPNSPTGAVLELDGIEEIARQARGLVVVDEAYVDFGHHSALALLDRHPNLLVLRTFSKSFSLAGMRLGLAFGAPDLIADVAKVKDSYNVSRIGEAVGIAALADYGWMKANVARVCATRERVASTLREKGFVVPESHANFLWVNCAHRDGGRPYYARLRERKVLVRYFDSPALQHGIRVTIGTDAQMDRFLAALD
jgi:histidinol-phosphate aminotransferase